MGLILALAVGTVVDVIFFAAASTVLLLRLLLWLIAVSSSSVCNGGVGARRSFVIIAMNPLPPHLSSSPGAAMTICSFNCP